jgi:hypothetical protein
LSATARFGRGIWPRGNDGGDSRYEALGFGMPKHLLPVWIGWERARTRSAGSASALDHKLQCRRETHDASEVGAVSSHGREIRISPSQDVVEHVAPPNSRAAEICERAHRGSPPCAVDPEAPRPL